MEIKIIGNANLAQAEAQFMALTRQVEALNSAMARTSMIPQGGSPAGYRQIARSMNEANAAFNSALASSGKFRVEQLKLNDAVARNTDLLQKQKLGFREVFGAEGRKNMRAIYKEQLAMNDAITRQWTGAVGDGSQRMTMAVPTEVHKSWDTVNNRVGMFRYQLKSASRELINWGKNTQWAGRQLMAGISMPVAAFGAAAGVMAYQVDKEMTRVRKVYDTTANANSSSLEEQAAAQKELQQLTEDTMNTGIEAAQKYGAAITETTSVVAELAATGQKGAALQQSALEVQRIATLGEIDAGQATQALIALQSTLGHTVRQTANDFNYMNSIENATSLTTDDFTKAIPRALAPMKEMGGSLQDLAMLMVAMKERGIEAGEGANAIKAMMQRLYRPSRQIREEWQQLTGMDPLEIVERNGGQIMQILPEIADAVRGLDKASRVKALSGLFGTYQVTRMSAMLQGLDQIGAAGSQTTRVLEVNSQSWQDWADVAERETKQAAESASGQFKRAYEGIRASLAAIGDPFLEVATAFLQVGKAGIDLFNSMPGWAKKGAIFVAILAAITGPIIMLIGLFANFAGNIGTFIGSALRLASTFEILNKNQWAAKAAASLAEKGFVSQASSAQMLQQRLEALTLASRVSAEALAMQAGMPLPMGMLGPSAAGLMHGPQLPSTNQANMAMYQQQAMAAMLNPNTNRYHHRGKMIPGKTTDATRAAGKFTAEDIARHQAYNRLGEEHMRQSNLVARNASDAEKAQARNARATATAAKASQTMSGAMAGGAVAGAAMAGSMITMMVTENEAANSIAKWVMISAIAVPAFQGLSIAAQAVAARMAVAAVSGRAMLATTSATAGVWRTMAFTIGGAARGIAAMMGPLGWAATILTGLVVGIKAWNSHVDKIAEKKREIARAMYDERNLAAETLGLETERRRLATVSATDRPGETTAADISRELRTDETSMVLVDSYNDEDTSQIEKDTILLKRYMDTLRMSGGDANIARRNVEAFFLAAGDGALEAQTKATEFYQTIGSKIDPGEMRGLWSGLIESSFDDSEESAAEQGQKMGEVVADTFARTAPRNLNSALDEVNTAMTGGWNKAFNGISDSLRGTLGEMGIATGRELNAIRADYDKLANHEIELEDFAETWGLEATGQQMDALATALEAAEREGGSALKNMAANEKAVVKEVAEQLGITEKITTMAELRNTWEWKMQTATAKTAKNLYKEQVARVNNATTLGGELSTIGEIGDETKLQIANQLRLNMGLNEADTLAEALDFSTKGVANNLNNAKTSAKSLGDAFQFSNDQMKQMLQEGIEGVKEDMGDMAMEVFDKRMQNALDNVNNRWDARLEDMEEAQERATGRMERRHENEQSRFEDRWEKRKEAFEKAYDNRIEAVESAIEAEQKAEEIRQRIFEAEQTRLSRAAEAANATIDFNLALQTGDLDEAAKLRNDMEATAQGWALSDAGDAGGTASQRRIERLEGRQETIEGQRDKALKALEEREEDERKSLERRQEREKKHLDRLQEMNRKNLEKQSEDAREAAERDWDMRKKNIEDQIELFKSMPAANRRQLKKALTEAGLSLADFGLNTLEPESQKWGGFFQKSLQKHVRVAGNNIANSNMWENMGARTARNTLLGMGFGNMNKFKKFVETGKLPDDFGKEARQKARAWRERRRPNAGGMGPVGDINPNATPYAASQHTGGVVGGVGGGSRKGVARTLKGLHPSEQLINAQKGEFIVNRDSAKRHGDLLNAVNNGTLNAKSRKNVGSGIGGPGGSGLGMMGLVAGALNRGLALAAAGAFETAFTNKIAQSVAPGGSFVAGKAGTYGDYDFGVEQLKNAATIASVGSSMGMSQRDIMIGIMTALAESNLVNVDYGDRDSLGLFQQRPSQGWGTPAQVTDPIYAATKFFNALKNIAGRDDMQPWEAAQAVQRSAFADGSNYEDKWNEARNIFRNGLEPGDLIGTGFIQGGGGLHSPSIKGKGWSNSHDYANGVGSPLYAWTDGVVTESRAVRSGGSSKYPGSHPGEYTSYGETIVVRGPGGNEVRYAHLDKGQRFVRVGQKVKGGALIGRAGWTGNASGPHTHFEWNGSYAAREYFAQNGIGLKTGGYTKTDGMANLHKDEVVVSPKKTKELYDGLDTMKQVFQEGAWTWLSGLTANGPIRGGGVGDGQGGHIGATSSDGTIRTGTYNVNFAERNANTREDLKRLMEDADVLSLSEMTRNKTQLLPWFEEMGWGIHGGNGDYVAWNKRIYNAVDQGMKRLNQNAVDSMGGKVRDAAYVRLRNKDTGVDFWQIAAHTITDAHEGNRRATQLEQFNNLRELQKNLSRTAPVILGGDLNQDPRRADTIKRIGLGAGRSDGAFTLGRSYLDHILFGGLNRTGQQVFRGNSDHKGLLAQFNIPGLAKGTEHVRWDNTLANLHKGESVLTKDISEKFRQGVDNFASGGKTEYNITVEVNNPAASADDIARKVLTTIQRQEARRPQRRTNA